MRSIEERPASIESKDTFGHWEGDLICGKRGSGYIVTFVERMTGYTFAWLCPNKRSATVNSVISKFITTVPGSYRKTITVDRGTEFYGYPEIEKKCRTLFYFCHPQRPQERGLNENTNGLLRQFFPKKMDFSTIQPTALKRVLELLAHRPRKTFGYKTTAEVMTLRGLKNLIKF